MKRLIAIIAAIGMLGGLIIACGGGGGGGGAAGGGGGGTAKVQLTSTAATGK